LVKRLQLLTELNPRIRRVLIFYQAANPVAAQYLKVGRDASQQLKIDIVERPVASPEAFRASLRALRPGDADAYTNGADGMIVSQERFVIEAATALRMPTILSNKEGVVMGGLAGYGVSYSEAARLSARHVRAVLLGADPGRVPVEHYDRVGFFLNLRTAKALGLTIPESVLAQAGEVIE
jgi:putative ABC transport system substrate-binding protein